MNKPRVARASKRMSKVGKIWIAVFVLVFVAVGAFVIYKSFASSGGAGSSHTCWVKDDTTLWCWGANYSGQLGVGDYNKRDKPTVVMGGVKKVALGNSHTCALMTDGQVYCWGDDTYGQVGSADVSTNTNKPKLVYVAGSANAGNIDLAAGGNSTCAIVGSGYLQCWGQNDHGQLGIGTNDTKVTPTPVTVSGTTGGPIFNNLIAVTMGDYHACANKTDGTIYCWGLNDSGQLGITTDNKITGDKLWPQQLFFTTKGKLTAGERHTCATKNDGTLWCWGLNDKGQLGIGNNTNQTKPVQVKIGSVDQVSAGYRTTCAGKTGSSMWCWGGNAYGQLGIDNLTNYNTPRLLYWTNTESISAGNRHTCASRRDNTLWCWGDNSDGQLGIGTFGGISKIPKQLYFNTFSW